MITDIQKYRNENECMGLYKNIKIEILTKNMMKGPYIVKPGDSQRKIVLRREMAESIIVETDD